MLTTSVRVMSEDQATPWTIGQEQIETAREAELDHELQLLKVELQLAGDAFYALGVWRGERKELKWMQKELEWMQKRFTDSPHVSEKFKSAIKVQVLREEDAKQFLMKLRNDLSPETKRQLDHAVRVVRGEASEQSYIDAWVPPEPPNRIM